MNNKIPRITKKLPSTNRWEFVRVNVSFENRFWVVLVVDFLAIALSEVLTKIQITNVYPINGCCFVFNNILHHINLRNRFFTALVLSDWIEWLES